MLKIKKNFDSVDNKLLVLYTRLIKIFLIISVLFFIWIVIIALGNFILEFEPNWAIFDLTNWILIWCFLISFFIILEIIFYIHYISTIDNRIEFVEPEPEFIHGKRLYVYTYPIGSKGGIFSKTYIQIDDKSVLRLKNLIIPPGELWNKEKK
jgi:hypothetical protein